MDHSPPGSSVPGFSRREYWSGLLCPSPGKWSIISVYNNFVISLLILSPSSSSPFLMPGFNQRQLWAAMGLRPWKCSKCAIYRHDARGEESPGWNPECASAHAVCSVKPVETCLLPPAGALAAVWNPLSQKNKMKTFLPIEIILIRSKLKRQKLQLSKSQEQIIQETGDLKKKKSHSDGLNSLFKWSTLKCQEFNLLI